MKKDYSEKEKAALEQFKARISDLDLNADQSRDDYLIRWLKAKDLNVGKAEELLKKSLKWRHDNKIDEILLWKAPAIFSEIYPMEMCGYDKSGCPIFVIPFKYFDIKKFTKCDKTQNLLFGVQNMERVIKAMKTYSTPENPVNEFVTLYDLDGINFKSMMNKQYLYFVQESTTFMEEHYPGPFIRKAYCLYSPKLFSMIFSMVKHIAPKKTIERFEIFGCNKEKWVDKLLEHITPENLPPRFGGTNIEFEKNAFAHCKAPTDSDEDENGCQVINVYARKKVNIEQDIEVPNSTLSWTFKVENYDIGFSINFGSEEIFPYQRIPADAEIQQSSVICTQPGKYTIVFDNSFSRLRSKVVHYNLEVTSS